MKYTLVVVGKTKQSIWSAVEQEFLDRLSHTASIEYRVIKPEIARTEKDIAQVKAKEAIAIMALIPTTAGCIVCDERGQAYTSTAFAAQVTQLQDTHGGHVCVIIGGTYGLDSPVLQQADCLVQLSAFTFTHEAARGIMWEQLYRASMIRSGRPYHY